MSSECTAMKREETKNKKDRSMYGEHPNTTIYSDRDSPIRVISVCPLQIIHIDEEAVAFTDDVISMDPMEFEQS